MMRWMILTLWLVATPGFAQAAPAQAKPKADAAPKAETPPPATAPAPTTQATPPPANPYPSAPPSAESIRLARERWRIEIMRARARRAAERANLGEEPELQAEVAPPPQHGDAGAAIAIGASWDSRWYTNPSYDLFSNDDVASRFGLWAAHDIASLRRDTFAALELGWGTEHATDGGVRSGTLSSELTTHAFYGGVQLRWVPLSWLQPHARLAAGAAVVSMALQASSQRFSDRGVSPFGSLGLGVTLRTPTRLFEDHRGQLAALSLGLMLEAGYTLAAPLDFTASGPAPGKGGIPIQDAKLGRLERSAPYARASIVVRF